DENVSGAIFGSVLRLPSATGLTLLVSAAGKFVDEWGNLNLGQSTTFDASAAGPVLFQGVSSGSTAPPRLARSALGAPMLFHGQFFDYDAGLSYMRARFYDPYTGEFLQPDPKAYEDSVN